MKNKQQPSIARVKHLKGEQAKRFIEAYEKSGISKDAASKVIDILKKGFIKGD